MKSLIFSGLPTLGTDKKILLSGKLSELADKIQTVRSDSRQRNGWIMDTYPLGKQTSSDDV